MKWYDDEYGFDRETQKIMLKEYKDTGDNDIKEKLIMSYTRYLKHVASCYVNNHKGSNYDDIMQAAALGLSKGIEVFDYEKSDELLKIAGFYVRSEMNNYRGTNDSVGIKPGYKSKLSDYYNAVEKLQKEGKKISIENIREETGFMPKTIIGLENALGNVSLDTSIGSDGFNLYEIIECDGISDINSEFIINRIKKLVSENEFFILSSYYRDGRSYQSIGDELDLSYERIRQKIERAKEKIKRAF